MKRWIVIFSLFFIVSFPFQTMAQGEMEEETVKLEEVVVTATRDWEEERKVPYNVSVITEEDIRRSNAHNVADVLRTVPGVLVSDWTANRKSVTVDIRGFGETGPLNTLVLVDGRRVNQVDLSGTDWVQIPIDQVERIEVIRGGGSVLYGDNAVGGVVNIITKKGKGKPSVKAEFLGGSYGLNIQRASSRGSLGDFRYTVNARHENTDGFRDNGYYEGKDFGGSVGYDLGDILKVDFSTNYHADRYGMPGALTEQDLLTMDRSSTTHPDDKGETEDWFVQLTPALDLKQWGRVSVGFSYRQRGTESKSYYIDWLGMGQWGTLTNDIPTFSVSPQWIWERDISTFHNKLIVGFDYYHTDAKNKYLDTGMGDPARNFLSSDADVQRDSWAFYFHDDFSILNNLIFSCGYRYEESENDFNGASWIGFWQSFQDKKDDVMHAWDVGLTYLFLKNSKIYGRISKSYRYPAIDEYFSVWAGGLNTLLEPQEGITYEVGVDHYFTDTIRSGLTFYWMEIENEIYYNPLGGPSGFGANENYDNTRHQGIEFSAEAKPLQWLSVWANYTYTQAKFSGGQYEGNEVPGVPYHKVNFGIGVTPLEGLDIDIWSNYVGERRFISDQPNIFPKLHDYMTVNAKVSYTWKFLTAFVGVNNIFDEKYSEYGSYSWFRSQLAYYPSPGINVLGGLSLQF
ncbi:MAG: TonB-dependent receptor [Syntrophobacterales bacterium]|nr:MAG: TonB-dependent receptor [Syntrophobacterales bacterium]